MINKPNYTAVLIADADIGVPLLKDWFEWADESKLLAAGMHLIFRLRSEVTGHLQGQGGLSLGHCCW